MSVPDNVSHVVVLTTLPNAEAARSLVRKLVADRLVACGTILDRAHSIYMWQGKLEEESEAMVILKTLRSRWDALQAAVQELHGYDVPELLALPVETGLQAYLDWVAEQTGEVLE
jgi:periplasmic divalent cation tolerance protein